MTGRSHLWCGASLAVIAAIAMGAAATHARADDQQKPAASTVPGVVITAERRVENLESTPIAANVLSQQVLDAKDIHSVDDLEYATPSLTVSSGGQSNYMNIRGIGKNDNSGTSTSAVATYRDGVGTVSGFFNGEPYYDIKSVEVLRGPQGTFVGQNAAGGAIFVNTRDPEIGGGYSGWLELGYANYNRFEAQGALNIPVSSTLALRIAFDHVNRDSFYHVFMDPAKTIKNPNHVGAQDLNSLRVGALWKPIDPLEIKLKVDLNNLDYHGNAYGVVPHFPAARGANLSNDPFVIGNNITDNFYVDSSARGALEIHYTLPDGIMIRSITGEQYIQSFFRNDDDGSVIPLFGTVTNQQNIQAIFHLTTQEIALVSPNTQRFSWIFGGYYQFESLEFPAPNGNLQGDDLHFTHTPTDGFVLFNTTDNTNEFVLIWKTRRITEAVFGQASYKLTDSLELQAGLRYSDYHVSSNVNLIVPGLEFLFPPFKNSERDGHVTGKVALNWQANPDNYFYVFAATGHTTGGVNVIAFLPRTFGPQETYDYEAGWKAKFFDGALHTQLGVFYDDIRQYQVTFTDRNDQIVSPFFRNLKTPTTVYGVELTGQGVIGDFSYDFGAAFIHSSAGNGTIFDSSIPGTTTTAQTDVQLAGRPLPYTPKATVNVGAQYLFHLPSDATLTPRVDVAWTGEQLESLLDGVSIDPFTGQLFHYQRVPAHTNINAEITYERKGLVVSVYGTNLTNQHYVQAASGGGDNAYENDPLQFGVRVKKSF